MPTNDLDPKIVAAGEKSAMSRLRLLDFDDLFLLSHLLEGATIAATARQLGLTQPAITQRVRKIERVFGEPILQKAGRHVRLTKAGRAVCVKATDALALMRAVTTEPARTSLVVGISPLACATWLWQALSMLRERAPQHLYHCVVSPPEETASLLETGSIDVCLATFGQGQSGVIELDELEYMLVTRPDLGVNIGRAQDLERQLLLEVDRSYPLLTRLEATSRAAVRFRDVWFLGSIANVLAAALAGAGVAVLPQIMVEPYVAAGKLAPLLPELELVPESYRLLFLPNRSGEAMIHMLAEALRTTSAKTR